MLFHKIEEISEILKWNWKQEQPEQTCKNFVTLQCRQISRSVIKKSVISAKS
jgi:hypothetical protein